MEEGEQVGDGRAAGSSATEDRGQVAHSLTPDMDGMFTCICESSQLEGWYVGDLLYFHGEVFVFFKVHICT